MNIFVQKHAKTTIKMLDFAHEIGLSLAFIKSKINFIIIGWLQTPLKIHVLRIFRKENKYILGTKVVYNPYKQGNCR